MQPWQRGFFLALSTAFLWGVLPIAQLIALAGTDVYTLIWYRFLSAALVLGALLARTGSLPKPSALRGNTLLLVVALAGLAGNFLLFLSGLSLTTPAVSQVVGQLSPVFLLVGGVIVFGERLSSKRWMGFALMLAGMLLFFNRRLPQLIQLDNTFSNGVALLALASFVWACFGLAQKQLLTHMGSPQILWLLYASAAIVLLPFATPGDIADLNVLQIGMFIFCCANTLLAYGALAEAMKCWDISRVGAVLSLTPIFAIGSSYLFDKAWPGFIRTEPLNVLGIAGALIVVGGSAVCALAAASPKASDVEAS